MADRLTDEELAEAIELDAIYADVGLTSDSRHRLVDLATRALTELRERRALDLSRRQRVLTDEERAGIAWVRGYIGNAEPGTYPDLAIKFLDKLLAGAGEP